MYQILQEVRTLRAFQAQLPQIQERKMTEFETGNIYTYYL